MKTSLILSVFALTACGWAPNTPSTPDAFAGETLTAVTVIPYFDRICGAREDATVECVDAPATIADPHPILAPLGDKVGVLGRFTRARVTLRQHPNRMITPQDRLSRVAVSSKSDHKTSRVAGCVRSSSWVGSASFCS